MGDFIPHIAQDFFPDNLGGDGAFRLVGQGIFGEVEGAFGAVFLQLVQYQTDPIVAGDRNGHNGGKGEKGAHFGDPLEDLFLFDQVDFVDNQDNRQPAGLEGLDQFQFLLIHCPHRFDEKEDEVNLTNAVFDNIVHMSRQLGFRLVETRRVQKAKLGIPVGQHPEDAGTGGLGFGGNDRDFFAQQRVHQRRFPDIGLADDSDKPGFGSSMIHESNPFVMT